MGTGEGARLGPRAAAGASCSSSRGRDRSSGERLLVATGRRPDLAALNVTSIGVDDTAPGLAVDDHLRVTDGVWAVGDVTGVGAFTHVSMYQADIAVEDILGQDPAASRLPRPARA